MNKKIVGSLLSIILISGCSTTPLPANMARPVPPDRLTISAIEPAKDAGLIVVTRDEGTLGSACYLGFSIDNDFKARFDVGETARFPVAPGERLIKVMSDPQARGLCAFDKGAVRETYIRPNETKYFRLLIDQSGVVDVQRTDQ